MKESRFVACMHRAQWWLALGLAASPLLLLLAVFLIHR